MVTRLDHRGWAAARWVAPCVICHQPAILRSPRGKPCHWTCAALRAYGVIAMATGPPPVLTGGRAVLVAVRIGVTVPERRLDT